MIQNRLTRTAVVLSMIFTFISCESLKEASKSLFDKDEAIKTLLDVGIKSATDQLSADGGYLTNSVTKILFPSEAQKIIDNISKVPLIGDAVINEFVESMNSAAEVASKEAYDIFAPAIREMSITDGYTILTGGDDAATKYLESKTRETIKAKYAPIIETAMSKPLIGSTSTAELWTTIFSNYNKIAKLSFGLIPAQSELDINAYVLDKAIDGIFVEIANAEKSVREDPAAWAKKSGNSLIGVMFQ